jgi:hypothetical protein
MQDWKFMTCGLVLVFLVQTTSCKSEIVDCPAVITCMDGVEFDFQPPIAAQQTVKMALSSDDADFTSACTSTYASTYASTIMSGPVYFHDDTELDGGGFLLKSAYLYELPSKLNYEVTVDNGDIPVTKGTVVPQYQQVTTGSDGCQQTCTQAKVTVAVTQ